MKLKTKFTLLVAVCTLLLLGVNYVVSVYSANKALLNFNQRSAVILTAALLGQSNVNEVLGRHSSKVPLDEAIDELFQVYPEQVFVLYSDGRVLKDNVNVAESRLSVERVESGYRFEVSVGDNLQRAILMSQPQLTFDREGVSFKLFWFPRLTLSRQVEQDALQDELNYTFLISLLALSGVAIVLSWLGASYFLRPLNRLKSSFNEIIEGNLNARLDLKRNDEVGQIIVGFNEMANWLQGLHQQYEQMNSDLAHELRTPLNAIRSRLEALEDGLLSPSKKQFKQLQDELAIVSNIVDDLNLLSLTQAGALRLDLTEVNVSELAQTVIDRYQMRAHEQQVELKTDIQKKVSCIADKSRLRQVLVNLIDNAFKYGADGGQITLSVKQDGHTVQLAVADNGVGLEQDQQTRVFERFYRVQSSRSSPDSFGLGLPICYQLVGLMKGTISLKSEPNQGARFTILFSNVS